MNNTKKLFIPLLVVLIAIDVLGVVSYLIPAKGDISAPLKALILVQDQPLTQDGPTQFTWHPKDCGGKSSSEAQALSLPAKLESCGHPVGELRWVSVNVGGLKYLIAVRIVENGSSNVTYDLTVREDASDVDPVNDPHNLFIKLESTSGCICSDYNFDLYVYDGDNPNKLIQSGTRGRTIAEELEIPLVKASSTPAPLNACDQTSKAVVEASGGCSNIDPALYKNVYNACCTVAVTKASILQMLNDALADGILSKAEKSSLLGALNSYLSAPTSTSGISTQTTSKGGDTATESFRASCDNIIATDSTIQAKCQRIDGSWVSASYRRVGCSTDIANMDGVLLCASANGGGGSTCTSNQGTLSLSMNSGSSVVIGGYGLNSSGRYAYDGGYSYSCYGYGPTGEYHNCSNVTIKSCQTTDVLIKWSQ